ncbi:Cyclin, N-terminal domain containing protein [Trichomonas vaginalis G3]|uniref:Cyclin, N-terminal domain containing protein n=1 Tax=Trichomonas vaginalis (strain ATCC PRA-98 / G3) TaxID=412133 RepID=A2FCN6_TRIV3|nr:cell division [Trichomonas vaginalis G3]EAX97311.1 Cyclin, N-terminal domain containing protein [Trichomonas vaginalis G3]KAI5526992.1 cell division [Trichomonas vaginalis G3]|eukprot:XP_001310241.1 Cyclin, N-terminal domain containing protein [Trichomonas vaginalis G3]
MQKAQPNRYQLEENKRPLNYNYTQNKKYVQYDSEYSDPSDIDDSLSFEQDDVIYEKEPQQDVSTKGDIDICTLKEYKPFIVKNILSTEEDFLPPSDYQRCKTKYRRAILDWLLRVHKEFAFSDDTLFTSIGLFDRISRTLKIKRCHFQLFAATSMWIAAKLQETTTPALSDFIYLCENSYNEKEFLDCERVFCSALRFNLTAPNPREFYMPITSKKEFRDIATVADMFMKVSMFSEIYDQTLPSVAAVASIYVATRITKSNTDCFREIGSLEGVDPAQVSNFAVSILNTFNWLISSGGEGLLTLVNEALADFPASIPDFTEEYIENIESSPLPFLE